MCYVEKDRIVHKKVTILPLSYWQLISVSYMMGIHVDNFVSKSVQNMG